MVDGCGQRDVSLTNSVLGILPIVALIELLTLEKEDSEQISYEPKYEASHTAGAARATRLKSKSLVSEATSRLISISATVLTVQCGNHEVQIRLESVG